MKNQYKPSVKFSEDGRFLSVKERIELIQKLVLQEKIESGEIIICEECEKKFTREKAENSGFVGYEPIFTKDGKFTCGHCAWAG